MSLTVAELQYRTKVWYTLGTVRMLWGPYGQENACILHIRSIYAAHTCVVIVYLTQDMCTCRSPLAVFVDGLWNGKKKRKKMRKIGQLFNCVRLKMLDYFPRQSIGLSCTVKKNWQNIFDIFSNVFFSRFIWNLLSRW